MAGKYLDETGLLYFWGKLKNYYQAKLVSGTNIKTINNESILGSGNITVSGSGGDHVELTQAEYDLLSMTEKNNGTVYFISDGEPDYTIINDSVPIGAIQAYGGSTAPYGWLICDGSAVSRVTYSELFTAIGTHYGSGDGSTTFNLPDLRGRVAIGASSSHALASTGGEETHTLSVSEMPSHNHLEYYTWSGASNVGGNWKVNMTSTANGGSGTWTHSSGLTDVSYTGGGGAHNNMQPYIATSYIIKALNTVSSGRLDELDPQHILFDIMHPIGSYYETSDSTFDPNIVWTGTWILETEGQVHVSAGSNYTIGATGGESTHTLVTSEIPSHTHSYGERREADAGYVPANGHPNAIQVRTANGTAAGGVFTDRAPNNYYAGSFIQSTGGGGAHNNMQPYIVVNRWHRTA